MKERLGKAVHWGLPLILTGLSLGWTVYAVGDVLSEQAPRALAFTVAAGYDAVWLYALAMETAHRRQGSKATLPATLGWAFLVISVVVLFAHGLMGASPAVAVIGAVVPVAAKATLIMAVDRDSTRISVEAQQQIDAIRSATRDQVAIGRSVTRAKADRQTAAALLEREEHRASGQAQKVRHQAALALTEVNKKHPAVGLPQDLAQVPALFSHRDLSEVLHRAGPTDAVAALEAAPDQSASEQASELASQQAARSGADLEEEADHRPDHEADHRPDHGADDPDHGADHEAPLHVVAADSTPRRRATGRLPQAAKSGRPRRSLDEVLADARTRYGTETVPSLAQIRTDLEVGTVRSRQIAEVLEADRVAALQTTPLHTKYATR